MVSMTCRSFPGDLSGVPTTFYGASWSQLPMSIADVIVFSTFQNKTFVLCLETIVHVQFGRGSMQFPFTMEHNVPSSRLSLAETTRTGREISTPWSGKTGVVLVEQTLSPLAIENYNKVPMMKKCISQRNSSSKSKSLGLHFGMDLCPASDDRGCFLISKGLSNKTTVVANIQGPSWFPLQLERHHKYCVILPVNHSVVTIWNRLWSGLIKIQLSEIVNENSPTPVDLVHGDPPKVLVGPGALLSCVLSFTDVWEAKAVNGGCSGVFSVALTVPPCFGGP